MAISQKPVIESGAALTNSMRKSLDSIPIRPIVETKTVVKSSSEDSYDSEDEINSADVSQPEEEHFIKPNEQIEER